MENKKPKIAHRSIRKVDAVVTGLILGGIVASIYGIEERSRKKRESAEESESPRAGLDRKIEEFRHGKIPFREILKMLVFGVPKEKPTLMSRIRSLFRKR